MGSPSVEAAQTIGSAVLRAIVRVLSNAGWLEINFVATRFPAIPAFLSREWMETLDGVDKIDGGPARTGNGPRRSVFRVLVPLSRNQHQTLSKPHFRR